MAEQEMDTTMSDETTTTETPETPEKKADVIGQLTEDEQQKLGSMRLQSQDILVKIGQMEVQKQRLMSRLDSMDVEMQGIMTQISDRLDVPEGQKWVALQDGSIRAVPDPAARTEG